MVRKMITLLWVVVFVAALYSYFFDKNFLRTEFLNLFGSSLIIAYVVYLIFCCLRGFTLIPVTYFIVAGLVLFPTWPLYLATMIGVMVSSLCVYYFSKYLNFDEYFESKYSTRIGQIKTFLSKNEIVVVSFWSAAPFLPTDLICYVCGTLEVDVRKLMLGVLVGEGVMCFVYIFFGKEVLAVLGF